MLLPLNHAFNAYTVLLSPIAMGPDADGLRVGGSTENLLQASNSTQLSLTFKKLTLNLIEEGNISKKCPSK